MEEIIGVVSGVIGIVSQALSQIEQLVDRCQTSRKAPAEFRGIKSDCKAVKNSLPSLEKNLQQNAIVVPENIERFKNDAQAVIANFKNVEDRCETIDKYFSTPGYDSSGHHSSLTQLRQASLRFLFAGRIARECEQISKTVRDAKVDGTELNRFLQITIQIKRVEYEIKEVGDSLKNVGKKAGIIEKEVKHVEEKVKAVDEKVDTIRQITENKVADANDVFKPNYNVPDLSMEILHNFSACNEEGEPITMEGMLKRALLNVDWRSEFSRIAVALGAGSMRGVGKTNALLGLGWDEEIREHFKHGGIYFLSLGRDAGVDAVIEQLALAVEASGGAHRGKEARSSKTLRGAIAIVKSWFAVRETLFLCDDIWATAESSVGYFRELKQLLTSRGRSRMVLSTGDQRIADVAGMPIDFGPRDPEGNLSRSILLRYAKVCEEDLNHSYEESQEAIGKVLRKCGGIPLTLGVAGRALLAKARNCDGGLQTAIVIYTKELETSTRKMMTEDMEGYPNFCATVKTSSDMVDEWAQKEGICRKSGGELVCSDLFSRMRVFPRQSRVPQNALKRLWGDVDEFDVNRIIEKLADLNVLSKREDRQNGLSVGLHDLVLEYYVIQAGRDTRSYHGDFLGYYLVDSEHGNGHSATVGDNALLDMLPSTMESRPWWSLSSDGYFPENVCWHLWKGGYVSELLVLLCDARWTIFRMRNGGLLGWKSDFESLNGALSEVKKETGYASSDGRAAVEDGVRLIKDGVIEAWAYLHRNERELGMQLHSHLFDVDEGVWPVKRYLWSLRAHCKKPWLLPLGKYWNRHGMDASVELVEVNVESTVVAKDASLVAMTVGTEVLVIDNDSRTGASYHQRRLRP